MKIYHLIEIDGWKSIICVVNIEIMYMYNGKIEENLLSIFKSKILILVLGYWAKKLYLRYEKLKFEWPT